MIQRILFVAAFLIPGVANATIVRLAYSGTVLSSSVGEIPVGTAFEGVIRYDTNSPVFGNGTEGFAQYSGLKSWDASFGGLSAYIPGNGGITVVSTAPGVYGIDAFQVTGSTIFGDRQIGVLPANSTVYFALQGSANGPLPYPVTLPTSIATGDFYYRNLIVYDEVNGTYPLIGEVSSVSTTLEPSAVPEPASWALMLAGFGLAGAALRRRGGLRSAVA